MSEPDRNPWSAGYSAFLLGEAQAANPHPTREEGSPGALWREGWKAAQMESAERPADDMAELLREALAYEAEAFNNQEEVDDADLLDWFADWRLRVAAALGVDAAPVKPQDAAHESPREDVR